MSMSLSNVQFGGQTMTAVGAMPETQKMNGPAPIEPSSVQNKFAANANTPLPKPGFSS